MSEPLVITLGCRLNAYESEVVRRHASRAGLENCVIVNRCAVTGEAVRQAAQAIRKLRRERPGARIVVTGCAAQVEPERFAAMAEVDHVIGNAEKMQAETFRSLSVEDTERVRVNDIMSVRETASHMIDGFGARAPTCRSRTAATTAARFASFLTGAGPRDRSRQARLWPKSAASPRQAIARPCSPASTSRPTAGAPRAT